MPKQPEVGTLVPLAGVFFDKQEYLLSIGVTRVTASDL
jgi:hypothetical protein